VAIIVAGCSGSSGNTTNNSKPTKAPASQQIYRYGDALGTDISSFDPGQATDQPSLEAITMVFTGLVQLNDQLQVQPQLAESYTPSANGLTWTFKLRPGLKFSDGTPLTSQDVVYSIDRALSPQISSLNGVSLTYLGLIQDANKRVNGKIPTLIGDSLLAPNPNTVVIKTSKKTGYFLQALSYPTSYVVEKKVIDQWGLKWTDHLSDNSGQGGDGPFKVKSYSHTTGIIFTPNLNYYGPKPLLQEVDFDFYKTPETAYAAYQANQVDITSIPPEDLEVAKTKTKEYSQNSQLTIDYLAMNYLDKPFDNINIRQAFELAINKDVLSTALYHGIRPPTCHIVPQGQPGYNASLTCPQGAPTSGNATKAKQLLQQGMQQEGWTSVSQMPAIKLTYESDAPTLANEVTSIRQQIQTTLGITIQTQILDFVPLLTAESNTLCTNPNYKACVGKGLQMWWAAWGADYPDPQDWTTLQFDKYAPNNEWNYGQNGSTNAAQQQLIQQKLEQADVTTDQATRLQMYNQSEQQLVNDVAWLPMDQRFGARLLKPYVIGRVFNAQTLVPPNDWGNVYIAVHQ
jgi:peptide/nickel transport system substrate-binding protein/oligopeptide transport system substrate-binding protein